MFIDLLIEISEMWNVNVAAYCLMPNHYHMMITPKKQGRLKPFIEFMEEDDSEEVIKLFSLKKFPSFFGAENFITAIKEKYYFKKKTNEVPESKNPAPTSDAIISAVCEHYGAALMNY